MPQEYRGNRKSWRKPFRSSTQTHKESDKQAKKKERWVETTDAVNAVGAEKQTMAEVRKICTKYVTLHLWSHGFQGSVEDEIFVAVFAVVWH